MGKSKKNKQARAGGDPVSITAPLAEQMLENKVRVGQRDKNRQHQEDESVSKLIILVNKLGHVLCVVSAGL